MDLFIFIPPLAGISSILLLQLIYDLPHQRINAAIIANTGPMVITYT